MRKPALVLLCTLLLACPSKQSGPGEESPPASELDAGAFDGGGAIDGSAPEPINPDGGCGLVCQPLALGCGSVEICSDGTDNDCDGEVDEGCLCAPGAVQRCFVGPPGKRHIGACVDGQQTCQGGGEFGYWGTCEGAIGPKAEVCNQLDDDCNGCADETLCCEAGQGTCPGPNDPRIPTGVPFDELSLNGSDFLPGAVKYLWKVTGGPCDQLLRATSGRVSYRLNSFTVSEFETPRLKFQPTLSGDYHIELTAKRPNGTYLECEFVVPVRAPGLRVELCWDTTGDDDLDLWMHRPNDTSAWVPVGASNETCNYLNCRSGDAMPDWGYPIVPTGICPGHTDCRSPRLDIDNINTPGVPENINVDRPLAGESFRVAVNLFSRKSVGRPHPMVNLYCGGALRATYGGVHFAGYDFGASPVTDFLHGGLNSDGSFWRVADITMDEPSDTCTVAPLHPAGTHAGYCVTTEPGHSFDGACSP